VTGNNKIQAANFAAFLFAVMILYKGKKIPGVINE
jgi:hypothetical protein